MNARGGDGRRLTLDDLAALNREMAALVRAGLPLEAGLREVADDFGHGPGKLAGVLARETSAGKSLAEAVGTQSDLPPIYRAVVDAGQRSGDLAAALEGFAETAARVAELRRIAAQASIYPLMVLTIAWIMLVLVIVKVIPVFEETEAAERMWIGSVDLPPEAIVAGLFGVPAAIVLLAAIWWRRSARARSLGRRRSLLRSIPGMGRAAALSSHAGFADLLQLLLSCRAPLEEALPLAARASDAALEAPAERIAERLRSGEPLRGQVAELRRLPPLVRTALVATTSESVMIAGLRDASNTYRQRAAEWVGEMAVLVPVGVTLALGVGVVGLYAVILMQPYLVLLTEMAHWSS